MAQARVISLHASDDPIAAQGRQLYGQGSHGPHQDRRGQVAARSRLPPGQRSRLVKQHIDSYNYFVDHDLKNIIKANERRSPRTSTPSSTSSTPTSPSVSHRHDTTAMRYSVPSPHTSAVCATSPTRAHLCQHRVHPWLQDHPPQETSPSGASRHARSNKMRARQQV